MRSRNKPDLSGFTEIHLPCPCKKSSDAFCLNGDGSGYCFSCGDFFKGTTYSMDDNKEKGIEFKYFGHRSIAERTFEFYGVKTKFINGEAAEDGFPYPLGAVKVRDLNDKTKIFSKGEMAKEGLFGKDKFDPGSKDSIIITEGEYDALAAYEMCRGKAAVVSVRSSTSAVSNFETDRDYINSFKKIYLAFDNDDAGQLAVAKVSGMFDFNKVYHIKLHRFKDANEYLENKAADDFEKAWQNAKRYSPNSIISSFADIRTALGKKQAAPIGKYPFSTLNGHLFGLHKGEFIIIKGKQGIGKTEICRAIVHENLHNTTTRMATIFLEEDQETTIKGVATYQMRQPVMIPDAGFSDDDVMAAYEEAVHGDDARLYIHSHFTSDDESEIVDNIRFLVKVAGCELIFLDNLTMLNTGREENNDERLRIDRIIRRLRNLVNELKFCLVLIAHTNDDGTTRGSRLPDIVANTVVQMNRDLDSNVLWFNVDKARSQGAKTGKAGCGIYDMKTYVLREPNQNDIIGEAA